MPHIEIAGISKDGCCASLSTGSGASGCDYRPADIRLKIARSMFFAKRPAPVKRKTTR